MKSKNKVSDKTEFTSLLNKILLIGSIITLAFNSQFFDPFNSPKFILTLLLAVWALGHLINIYRLNLGHPNLLQKKVLAIVSLFILGQTISFIATDNKVYGLLGDVQRRNSFLLYFSLVTILLLVSKIFRFSSILILVKFIIVLSLSLSIYGTAQIQGKDFVNWVNPYNSMISTLGNPNFASAMLAVLTIISAGSFLLMELSKTFKLLSVLTSALSLYAIINSQSRQGIIVLLVGAITSFTFIIIRKFPRFRLLTLTFCLSLSTVGTLGMLQIGPLTRFLYKESVSVRGYYWRAGTEMFKDHVITGVGQDGYGMFFKQYREIAYSLKYGFDITSSNAHNVPIQIFATSGMFSGIGYLLLLMLIFVSGLRIMRSKDISRFKSGLVLFSSWIGFQAQSMISIDNIGVSIWGWILGGAILALGMQVESEEKNYQFSSVSKNKSSTVSLNLFSPIFSLLILIPTLFLIVLLYRAETEMVKIRSFSDPSKVEFRQVVDEYAIKVLNNQLANPYYKFQAALSMMDMGNKMVGFQKILDLSNENPRDLNILGFIAFYENRNMNYLKEVEARTSIRKYDPWNFQNLFELAKALKEIGKSTESESIVNFILTYAPDTQVAIETRKIDWRA